MYIFLLIFQMKTLKRVSNKVLFMWNYVSKEYLLYEYALKHKMVFYYYYFSETSL